MLKLKYAPKDTYKSEVKIEVPGDLGQSETVKLVATFRRLDATQTRALFKGIRDATAAGDDTDLDAALLKDNLIGWTGLTADDGSEIPFSADALTDLANITCYRRGLVQKFLQDLRGPQEVARKN